MQAVGNRASALPAQTIIKGLAVFGALCAVAIVVLAVAFSGGAIRIALGAGAATTSTMDALTAPQTVAFRASERAEAPAYVGDALAAPWVIQFRSGEHVMATVAGTDPLTAPALIQFRGSEHSEASGTWTGDPLSAPSLVEFRNSEHSEAP